MMGLPESAEVDGVVEGIGADRDGPMQDDVRTLLRHLALRILDDADEIEAFADGLYGAAEVKRAKADIDPETERGDGDGGDEIDPAAVDDWRDEEYLRERYLDHDETATKIARRLDGVETSTVRDWLYFHDIRRVDHGHPWTDRGRMEALVEDYHLTSEEVAQVFDTSQPVIQRWWCRFGLLDSNPDEFYEQSGVGGVSHSTVSEMVEEGGVTWREQALKYPYRDETVMAYHFGLDVDAEDMVHRLTERWNASVDTVRKWAAHFDYVEIPDSHVLGSEEQFRGLWEQWDGNREDMANGYNVSKPTIRNRMVAFDIGEFNRNPVPFDPLADQSDDAAEGADDTEAEQ